jgi:amino acid permease
VKNKTLPLKNSIPRSSGSVAEGVFLITGMTIGAGILGLPYAIMQVGLKIGLVYLFGFGILMVCLNLMIAETAENTPERFQLAGLAGKYIGAWACHILSFTTVLSGYGAMLAYIIGEGTVLATLLGGNPFWWSIGFWLVGSCIVWRGLSAAKNTQKFLSFLVILIIGGLSVYLLRSAHSANWLYTNTAQLLFPYGIILFALHGSPAVIEAKALLEKDPKKLRRAVIIGSSIPVFLYALFVAAVLGALGTSTSPVATVALSARFGDGVLLLGNLFALGAMATSFVGMGIALKETLVWDDKLSPFISGTLMFVVPIFLFILGLRNFIGILNVVGALFIGFEVFIMILVYWRAKDRGIFGTKPVSRFPAWFLTITVAVLFISAIAFSLLQNF